MKGSTGLAGLAVTALVAALVSFSVAALLGPSPAAPALRPGPGPSSSLEREVASLRAEVAELRSARGGPARGPRPAAEEVEWRPGPGDAVEGAALAGGAGSGDGEGTLPATREDLLSLIDQRIDAKGAGGPEWKPPAPKPRVTVEEAGAEMGLTAFEVDAVRRAYEAAETEMITCVMGTADLDAIKEEVRAAKEDPDRKAALVNKAVGNVIRNLGKVMTIEDRRDRDLKKVLTGEQVSKLKGYNLKPTLADAELEDILKDAFGNR